MSGSFDEMFAAIIAALQLIAVTSVDGRIVFVNPQQIVSLREAREQSSGGLMTGGVHCMIMLVDGKYQTVKEDCATVRKLIEGLQ